MSIDKRIARSKRIQNALISHGDSGLICNLNNGRWIKAYPSETEHYDQYGYADAYQPCWRIDAGFDGMPRDYTQEYDTLHNVVSAMLDIRDLRSWHYIDSW